MPELGTRGGWPDARNSSWRIHRLVRRGSERGTSKFHDFRCSGEAPDSSSEHDAAPRRPQCIHTGGQAGAGFQASQRSSTERLMEDLLEALLWPEPRARLAWDRWRSGIEIDRVPHTAQQLFPALSPLFPAWLEN